MVGCAASRQYPMVCAIAGHASPLSWRRRGRKEQRSEDCVGYWRMARRDRQEREGGGGGERACVYDRGRGLVEEAHALVCAAANHTFERRS